LSCNGSSARQVDMPEYEDDDESRETGNLPDCRGSDSALVSISSA
jgi:hypothetical protein